ncbi:unnamed protein product [Microthlaspi erraticum]|uniref:At3g05675-like ankyrin-like domain-containing protein n=1 Tax=Microthlaspi erraticum TaxID=1685480 RepID=A0A6D2JIT3_9BRAS|nr:unnamed protein product [Microthlaspi erraticum]
MLYSLCHRCLLSLILCLSEATSMNDPGDLVGEISREAGNLLWIVDILIEKKICEEFVQLWGEQKELANLHSKIPAKYRHEISKITARICVGIGSFSRSMEWKGGGGWTQPDDTDIVVESATGGSGEVVRSVYEQWRSLS